MGRNYFQDRYSDVQVQRTGQIYRAGGRPSELIGHLGSFFINTDTDEVWGPKTYDGWGSGPSYEISSNSIAQKLIWYGSTRPYNLLGNDGEYYLAPASTPPKVFGPKAAGAWPENGSGPPIAANFVQFLELGLISDDTLEVLADPTEFTDIGLLTSGVPVVVTAWPTTIVPSGLTTDGTLLTILSDTPANEPALSLH